MDQTSILPYLLHGGAQMASLPPAFSLSHLSKDYLDRVIKKQVSRHEAPMEDEEMLNILRADPKLQNSQIGLSTSDDPSFVGGFYPKDNKGNDEISLGKDFKRPSTFYHEYGHLLNEKTPVLKQVQQLSRLSQKLPYRIGKGITQGVVNKDEADPIRGAAKSIGVGLLADSPNLVSELSASIHALNKMKGMQRSQALPALGASFLAHTVPDILSSGVTGAAQSLSNKYILGKENP